MKIAIVHDWLQTWAGAEHVLQEMVSLYPSAEVFTLVDFLSAEDRARLGNCTIRTSFLQRLPRARTSFRRYLPLFPKAIESLDVSSADLIISNSHAVAKGITKRPGQLHVCYCYTPMRYAWDLRDQYLAQVGLDRGLRGWVAGRMLERIRRWDQRTSAGVDDFIAISRYIAERIERAYSCTAQVIYPPVTQAASPPPQARHGYVTVSRLVPYKRIDLIAAAFRAMPDRELTIVGEGPERARIEAAAGPNVKLLGYLPDQERNAVVAGAQAFIFTADEDFGLAPLEAQSLGTPVIGLGRGGTLETIPGLDSEVPTGVLFTEQSAAAIVEAVARFEAHAGRITPEACRANAALFSHARFRDEFVAAVNEQYARFRRSAAR